MQTHRQIIKFHTHVNDYQMDRKLEKYIDILKNLKCCSRSGTKAPHKAIYLISIIDMVALGAIDVKKFQVDEVLIKCFEYNWTIYVGNNPLFNCNIWNPLYYIEQDVIIHNPRPGYENVKPASINKCGEVYEFMKIHPSLWKLLTDVYNRNRLRELLVQSYLINNQK